MLGVFGHYAEVVVQGVSLWPKISSSLSTMGIDQCPLTTSDARSVKPCSIKVKTELNHCFVSNLTSSASGLGNSPQSLWGYAQDLTIEGLMETNPAIIWAGQYLCALGKALLDDAKLGMMR